MFVLGLGILLVAFPFAETRANVWDTMTEEERTLNLCKLQWPVSEASKTCSGVEITLTSDRRCIISATCIRSPGNPSSPLGVLSTIANSFNDTSIPVVPSQVRDVVNCNGNLRLACR